MIIANRQVVVDACRKHTDAKGQLEAWFAEAEGAKWHNPGDIRQRYASASILRGNVVIFNIKGNHYRLVVKLNYAGGIVLVKWFGTHAAYDKVKF